MSLLTVVLTIVVVGVLLWVINKYVPMELKKLLNAVVIIVMVIWLLKVSGLFAYLGNVKI
ncbi:MAG TPA: Thivi_2564 family membrane protein [Candidatus Eisenbacteria bacterium]|nr:Thivi_2564 family membrane protein [Candidatus Eisenbacteria bacterium]